MDYSWEGKGIKGMAALSHAKGPSDRLRFLGGSKLVLFLLWTGSSLVMLTWG